MKKSRTLMVDAGANAGKLAKLEALHVEYLRYLRTCVGTLIAARRTGITKKEFKTFFPRDEVLSYGIRKAVHNHAVGIVSGWSAAAYTNTIKRRIKRLKREEIVDDETAKALFTIGKHSVDKPSETISLEALDFYWALLLDEKLGVRAPRLSNRVGMQMALVTCTFRRAEKAKHALWWLRVSSLEKYRTVALPLVGNPFVKRAEDFAFGVFVHKDRRGRWRVQPVERKDYVAPKPTASAPRRGLDVGLNSLAAASDGRTFGEKFKPAFDQRWRAVKKLRANRQRQGLHENSPRLDALEAKLTGFTKTAIGHVANTLVADYPGYVFVVEDLDLRGCRGQKRFAYRLLQASLATKAPCIVVNPAFTSQRCPSCGYCSRANRQGTKFLCRGCGRTSHADVVGAINLLGRSEDQGIGLDDDPPEVKALLRERYRLARDSSSEAPIAAPARSGRRLTTPQPAGGGIASNASEITS